MMRWPWRDRADPARLVDAQRALGESHDNLALAETMHQLARAEVARWRRIEHRNGLKELVHREWRGEEQV